MTVEVILSARLTQSGRSGTAQRMDGIARVLFPAAFLISGAWTLL